jgi:predicted XRE-type DNA-binding protein
MSDTPCITDGSANVFADLGLADADELLAKADLAIAIVRRVEERGLTQADAARLLRTTQPRISDLRRGRLERFSIDTLLRLLTRVGVDVELRFAPKQGETARVRVVDPAAQRAPTDARPTS